MKLFKVPPQTVVRIEIIERGKKSKTITVDETDPEFVAGQVKQMLSSVKAEITPLVSPKKVSVQCYSCISNKKGKFSTFTVHTLSVDEIHSIIMDNLEKN